MRPRLFALPALSALLSFVALPAAGADPLDALGFGPRAAAMGTAGLAEGEALEAAHGNPAAAGVGSGLRVALGWLFAVPVATLNGRDAGLDAAHGVLFGAAVPFDVFGLRLGAGLALHVPDRFFARAALPGGTEPRLLRWSDWIHRTSASAVLSADVGGGFSLGAGVVVLADATARGTIEIGAADGVTWGTADVELAMPLRAAPVAGLLFRPAPWLSLGLTYRGELSMDVELDVRAHADFADESLAGTARTRVHGTASYTPRTLAFGLTGRWAGFTVDIDVAWNGWSGFDQPFAQTDTAVALGAPAPIVHLLFPHPSWEDTLVPSAGLEYELVVAEGQAVAVRAGYSYESSPVPPQTGLGNVADPDRHLVSLGAGWRMELEDAAIFADFALQAHVLVPLRAEKDVPEFAGEDLRAGGQVWAGQLWAGVEL
ncbi:MAG: outer membrane protein transport protein [Deltaproteobacteria bacterium]|nr:outer membrane protein transport protein [Deltaproteobacteria bacterium]